ANNQDSCQLKRVVHRELEAKEGTTVMTKMTAECRASILNRATYPRLAKWTQLGDKRCLRNHRTFTLKSKLHQGSLIKCEKKCAESNTCEYLSYSTDMRKDCYGCSEVPTEVRDGYAGKAKIKTS
ncbi:unnamed protein product, partial [Amoebophrya sp. A25]